jgi:hypothetical protein
MFRFFSTLLAIFLSVLSLAQPAMAENGYPKSTVVLIPYPSYDPIKEIRLKTFLEPTKPKYVASGPLFTTDLFRYTWTCPSGSFLTENACFSKSINDSSEESIVLTDPAAVQIAFAYYLDDDASTNGQIIYSTSIESGDIHNLEVAAASDDDLDANNPRNGLHSICPNGVRIRPPSTCAR